MQHIFSWWNPATALVVGVVSFIGITKLPYIPDGPSKAVMSGMLLVGFLWSLLVFATM